MGTDGPEVIEILARLLYRNEIPDYQEANRVVIHQNHFAEIVRHNIDPLNRRVILTAWCELRRNIGHVSVPARQCRQTCRVALRRILWIGQ